MTLVRGMFLAAFLMLTAGSVGIHSAVAPLFSGLGGKSRPTPRAADPTTAPTRLAARALSHHRTARVPSTRPTATPSPIPSATTTVTATPAPGITFLPTGTPLAGGHHALRRRLTRRHLTRPRRTHPTPTPTAAPTATHAAGTVTLVRYWISSVQTRRGRTISVSYVIDNTTGRTERVMLGASIKATRALSWMAAGISDPADDVVATVPPGISTHLRYFAVSQTARPGTYDVAWGLRNAVTGRRLALVFAPAVLRVSR